MVKVLEMVRVNILLPNHIKVFLEKSCSISGLLRSLAIDFYRKSRYSEVELDSTSLKVIKIDLESDTIEVEIPEEIRKALGSKTKRIAIQL